MKPAFLFVLALLTYQYSFAQKIKVNPADNGLSVQDGIIQLGGLLKKTTSIIGNNRSFYFSNIDSFDVTSANSFFNSTGKTEFSSGGLSLSSLNNISINAVSTIIFNGGVRLNNYKSTAGSNSILAVDELGNLKVVTQAELQENLLTYKADNGIVLENNVFGLGGRLMKNTNIDGRKKSLRFNDLDTFFIGGRYVQFINSLKTTTISSNDSLNLLSFNNLLLSANDVVVDGNLKLTGYKNSNLMDSVLTVDTCGNLKLVSQSSLQTIAQNSFMNNGNSFGATASLGTNDANSLNFRTNRIVRGTIDASGVFSYNHDININNAKLKAIGNIEINGSQPFASSQYEKASRGINFVDGGENLTRGTISFNSSGMNYTSLGPIRFFSAQGGVPLANSVPDFSVAEGVFQFGGKKSRSQPVESTAAYHFKNYFADNGLPKGILFPSVANHERAVFGLQNVTPAIGLMFFNRETQNLEIYKTDGWHKFVTENVNKPAAREASILAPTQTAEVVNSNSFVQALGDGDKKSFKISHNLNAQFVMVQFIDCGPEANCNLLQILPKGVRVELDGKNNALITFDEAPSFNRYKVMFLRVQ